MSKTTTPEQYEKLADIMATKRDVAQGFQQRPKEEVKEFWEEIANDLNALGPPSKDSSTWRKVWIDWKSYIKRKLSANKKEIMSTGGGQCRLQPISPLEEKVIALTGLETCTSGIRGARAYGDSAQVQDVAQTSEMDISACSEDRNEIPSCSRVSSQRGERRTDKESASSLLKEQIALQKEFYEDTKNHNEAAVNKMEEVVTYLRRMNRPLECMADTAVKQLQEQKRHNKMKEELLREKVEIKMRMLKLDPNYKSDSE
ncbi:uncharacterized protein LOC125779435 isoform X1 [Bactrocera dorsalis]|uniref:Regulatory protein zeste n=1 Tax=Bactrocera dorsalis TaxID=27457 RepID=A0ABM3K5J7_BACDO|nr:uncharacterized protein LOC125779435 isoform X1 [Bactrocera dorsalis]XP_049316752.1 uncharacterized protein LOC125779435 isoform X1 [Bactrocera dorsalis]